MLILHGSGADVTGSANWRGQIPALAPNFRDMAPYFRQRNLQLYGRGSRPTLETLVRYLDEHELTSQRISVEELFVPNIRPHYEANLDSFYH